MAAFGISRYGLEDNVETARAVTFSVLVFDELLRSLAARSNRKTIFQLGWFRNPWLLGAVLACCLLQTAVMLTPGVRGIFAMPSLDLQHLLLILWLSLIPIYRGRDRQAREKMVGMLDPKFTYLKHTAIAWNLSLASI